jgi:hypothetical protein
MRTLCGLPCQLVWAVNHSVTAEYRKGVDAIAQQLILVEGYASQEQADRPLIVCGYIWPLAQNMKLVIRKNERLKATAAAAITRPPLRSRISLPSSTGISFAA